MPTLAKLVQCEGDDHGHGAGLHGVSQIKLNCEAVFMSRRLIELEFDLAAEVAAKLARLPEAQDLPGYWGRV